MKKLRGRRVPGALLISFDWTKVRSVHVLMAAVVIKGRAIPLCWGSYADKTLGKSQNALEEALLLVLREMLGADVKVILLADRGFGRADLGRFCQRVGFDYVIRIKSRVQVKSPAKACGWTATRCIAASVNCTGTCSTAGTIR